jgi:gamma-glutamyltranspeptidase / glutathione hydrolase / leukotriene-C4 hydrolase
MEKSISTPVWKPKRRILFWVLFVSIFYTLYLLTGKYVDEGKERRAESAEDTTASGYNGVVSSENKICSQIGVDILQKGGSAVDSVIATSLCIGTTNMHSSGIGGGGFLLVRMPGIIPSKSPKPHSKVFNFREKASQGSDKNMYNKDPILAQVGGMAVGVPGELKGFQKAHEQYGRLPWKSLFLPSIALARRGWTVSTHFANRVGRYEEEILADEAMRRVLARNGTVVKAGEWMNRPVYANTLQSIADHGADVFYTGWISTSLVNTVQRRGGILTKEDMKTYDAEETEAMKGRYKDLDIFTVPPPARLPNLMQWSSVVIDIEYTRAI